MNQKIKDLNNEIKAMKSLLSKATNYERACTNYQIAILANEAANEVLKQLK